MQVLTVRAVWLGVAGLACLISLTLGAGVRMFSFHDKDCPVVWGVARGSHSVCARTRAFSLHREGRAEASDWVSLFLVFVSSYNWCRWFSCVRALGGPGREPGSERSPVSSWKRAAQGTVGVLVIYVHFLRQQKPCVPHYILSHGHAMLDLWVNLGITFFKKAENYLLHVFCVCFTFESKDRVSIFALRTHCTSLWHV